MVALIWVSVPNQTMKLDDEKKTKRLKNYFS